MPSPSVIKAYLAEHVKTPHHDDWYNIIRQLSTDEKDQVITATEAQLDAMLETAAVDMVENTLATYAIHIEAARQLEWAEVEAAQQIIANRKETS